MKLLKHLKFFSKKIADFQAVVVLTICFYLIAPLFVPIIKLSKKEENLSWGAWSIPSDNLKDMERQY